MIELSQIGERLLAAMINRSVPLQDFLAEQSPAVAEARGAIVAEPDARLQRCGKYDFDAAHQLDVALFLGKAKPCLGIEAKLGDEELLKTPFEKRFLKGCGTSHGGSRIAGSMISILEGKLPEDCDRANVVVERQGTIHKLLPTWFLIVRKRTLDAWLASGRPDFSRHCIVLTFEALASRYGDRDSFNALVRELVDGDYHRAWVDAG